MKHRFPASVVLRLQPAMAAGAAFLRLRHVMAVGVVLLGASVAALAPAGPATDRGTPGGTSVFAGADTSRPRAADGAGGAGISGAGSAGISAADGTGTSTAARAEAALDVLGAHVVRASDAAALRTAFLAYYNYREAHPVDVRKPYLYFVDLGLGNASPRGWVFDMDSLAVVDGPFTVAHGRGSGPRNGTPTRFSNAPGTYASSLGLYLAQETYTFTGKSGGRRYASVGLRLRGESGEFNGAALARGIVAHGAPYVTSREAGRSEGCPAMEPARAKRVLPLIANGGVVFLYSPNDPRWLAGDPWVNAGVPTS